jgi:hypothetical protein
MIMVSGMAKIFVRAFFDGISGQITQNVLSRIIEPLIVLIFKRLTS